MNLVRTENGLQVHQGGQADDREIGPEHSGDLTTAINNLTEVTRHNLAFMQMLWERLPAKERAALLGVSPRTERRLRRIQGIREALK